MDIVILDYFRAQQRRTFAPDALSDCYLDTRDLHPGDLLLFSPNLRCGTGAANKFPFLIESVQRTTYGYCYDDARWHHAAIYVGNGQMIEALYDQGVVVNPLAGRFPNHLLRVRRTLLDTVLQSAVGETIAQVVQANLGKPYQIQALFAVPDDARPAFVCSSLFADALELSLDQVSVGKSDYEKALLAEAKLLRTRSNIPFPAFLSETPRLQDIAIHWK